MAAGEDQSESVVAHWPVLFPVVAGAARYACDCSELLMKLVAACRAAQFIDCAPSCGRNYPPRRVGRDAVASPPLTCHDECVLNRVFGERDVAEDANQSCHRLAVHLTEHALNFPLGSD